MIASYKFKLKVSKFKIEIWTKTRKKYNSLVSLPLKPNTSQGANCTLYYNSIKLRVYLYDVKHLQTLFLGFLVFSRLISGSDKFKF